MPPEVLPTRTLYDNPLAGVSASVAVSQLKTTCALFISGVLEIGAKGEVFGFSTSFR
jgi:hypothetical protein